MSHEPPQRAGRPRSDAAARLAALLSEFEAPRPSEGEQPARSDRRKRTAGSDRAPGARHAAGTRARSRVRTGEAPAPAEPLPTPSTGDAVLTETGPEAPSDDQDEASEAAETTEATEATQATESTEAKTASPDEPAPTLPGPAADDDEPEPGGRRPRRRRVGWKNLAFGVTLVVLIGAIPALAVTGARTLYRSRDGQIIERITDPRAPGYQAIVDPTPTALVVQRDDDLDPIALTVIGLGTGDTGGSVLFVPMETTLAAPADGFFPSLREAYEEGGNSILINETARILGFGFDRVIDLDDRGWGNAVAQVTPLTVDNPDPVDNFPAGQIELDPNDVGPYLAAITEDESDLNRLVRHEAFWDAWLQSLARAGSAESSSDPVVDDAGLFQFVGTLAGGSYQLETLAVTPSDDSASEDTQTFEPEPDEVRIQATEAVPFPVSPIRGARFRVRLLNGVSGTPIPENVLERLVAGGAQITAIGNADAFGRDTTSITYFEPGRKADARRADRVLGGSSEIRSSGRTNESVDLVIILGTDVLERTGGGGAAGGTTGGAGGG